jgi:hypothetical protein
MDTFILISLFVAFSSLIGFACFKIGWVTGYGYSKREDSATLQAVRSAGVGVIA